MIDKFSQRKKWGRYIFTQKFLDQVKSVGQKKPIDKKFKKNFCLKYFLVKKFSKLIFFYKNFLGLNKTLNCYFYIKLYVLVLYKGIWLLFSKSKPLGWAEAKATEI